MKIKNPLLTKVVVLSFLCYSFYSCTSSEKQISCRYTPLSTLTQGNVEGLQELFNVQVCMDTSKITFKINWSDDIIDTALIPESERRWKDPEGKIRDKDKMYFYDNLGIRLFAEEYFYEGWIMPTSNGIEFQWQNQGSMKTRTSSASSGLLVETTISQDSSLSIKARLLFDEIGFNITDSTSLKVVLIIVDTDVPNIIEMKSRIAYSQYYVLEEELQVKDNINRND